jgi:hypothetical protein
MSVLRRASGYCHWAALLLLLGGCGHPGAPDAGVDVGVWAAFALGIEGLDAGFEAFPSEVEATAGAQGGFHVPVMYRVQVDQALDGVHFEHRVRRVTDNRLVSKGERRFDVAASGWTTSSAVVVFICPTPVGVAVVNEVLSFEVTATRAGQTLGTAAATAVFHCPSGDPYCLTVCKG